MNKARGQTGTQFRGGGGYSPATLPSKGSQIFGRPVVPMIRGLHCWANHPHGVKLIHRPQFSLGYRIEQRQRHGREKDLRFGTWNIRSLTGKEVELTEEMKKYKVQIMGLSEVRRRKSGVTPLNAGYTMIWSGVNEGRAREGVALVIKDEYFTRVESWDAVSSRFVVADLNLAIGKSSIIQVYAPTDDSSINDKNQFYEDLQKTIDYIRYKNRKIIIMGDWNGRIGNDNDNAFGVLGLWGGETVRNDSGNRLIDLCLQNDMIIGNSHYNHKTIHKITFEARERNVKSIIDYFVYDKDIRRYFTDIKVIRGAELGTDHYLLIADTKIPVPRALKQKAYERIDVGVLRSEEKQEQYRNLLARALAEVNADQDIDPMWNQIKDIILKIAEEIWVDLGTQQTVIHK